MGKAGISAFLVAALIVSGPSVGEEASEEGLYRITMLRAAPGNWVKLKAVIEGQGEAGATDADGRLIPYRIRHSQGAHWDFMLIQPIADLGLYFGDATAALETPFRSKVSALADFAEDWVVSGPSHYVLKAAYPGAGMFLVEMFRARAGMKGALLDSRHRENAVLVEIDTSANFVFVGRFGADWDVMTIGFYESLSAYAAAGSGISPEEEDRAARAHGFDGIGDLAPSLRSLLTEHSDTLATAMK